MKKHHKQSIVAIVLIVSGWLSGGIGYGSSNLGSILPGLLFYGGGILFFLGIIVLVISAKA
ncbi:hypothetical protein GR160_18505 [Flavobacterium sp. Sd200]|uniref:hypothetical protein n=1 Tax=Flavobacterium sp. Sd200 TaxID=2692211 RepID=UPI001368D665|nr:hypothetical protein [Flavobacterium sp. Sd200]MXN93225.1 hypothetical protein [Flavobacterium sp. Sd200]